MKSKRIILLATLAVGGSLGWLTASSLLAQALAQDKKADQVHADGTQLPVPDPAFKSIA